MPGLDKLLSSSLAVIVRYHKQMQDSYPPPERQDGLPPITESAAIEQLLAMSYQEMMDKLAVLIKEATTDVKVETRLPLLVYVQYNIGLMRKFADTPTPLEEGELANLAKELVQFIINIQKLIATSHSTLHVVHYNGQDVGLYGFVRGATKLYSLCKSGAILQDTLFSTFGLTANTTELLVGIAIAGILGVYKPEVRELAVAGREAAAAKREKAVKDLEAEIKTLEAEIKALETAVVARKSAMVAREAAVAAREAEVAAREAEVAARGAEVAARESGVQQWENRLQEIENSQQSRSTGLLRREAAVESHEASMPPRVARRAPYPNLESAPPLPQAKFSQSNRPLISAQPRGFLASIFHPAPPPPKKPTPGQQNGPNMPHDPFF